MHPHVYPEAEYLPVEWAEARDDDTNPTCAVLHLAASEADSLGPYFTSSRVACSHMYVKRGGASEQYIRADRLSAADYRGSDHTFSIETQGADVDGEWDAGQRETLAKILVWLHQKYGIPLETMGSSAYNEVGVGWHRLGVNGNFPDAPSLLAGRRQIGFGELWSGSFGKVCVPTDSTDLLTSEGWVPVGKVDRSHRVASVTDCGDVVYEHSEPIPAFMSDVMRVGGFEATPEHLWPVWRNVRVSGKGRNQRERQIRLVPTADLGGRENPIQAVSGGPGLPLQDDEVRIAVWLQADGHYMRDCRGVEWHFSKSRKVSRVSSILTSLGIEFSADERSDGTSAIRVWGDWSDHLRAILPNKRFGKEWLGMSPQQVNIFWEEAVQADGDSVTGRKETIFSSDKESLDTIQAATVASGRDATMWFSGGLWWLLRRKHPNRLRDPEFSRFTEVACVTTATGTLIMRQNGRTVVTGNCPGDNRIRQIPGIVRRAREIAESPSMPPFGQGPGSGPLLPTPPSKDRNGLEYDMRRLDLRNAHRRSVRGADVKKLQSLLMAHGYGPKGLVNSKGLPDGIAARMTRLFTARFQVKHNTGDGNGNADHIVGEATWSALIEK